MYEERVICEVFSHTDTPPESKRHMAFLIRFLGAGQQFTIVAKVPFRLELIGVVTEYCPVMVAMPQIRYACGAF
jgi:hypothetical protein